MVGIRDERSEIRSVSAASVVSALGLADPLDEINASYNRQLVAKTTGFGHETQARRLGLRHRGRQGCLAVPHPQPALRPSPSLRTPRPPCRRRSESGRESCCWHRARPLRGPDAPPRPPPPGPVRREGGSESHMASLRQHAPSLGPLRAVCTLFERKAARCRPLTSCA